MKIRFLLIFSLIYINFIDAVAQTQPASYSSTTNGVIVYDKNGNTPMSSSALLEMRTSTKGMLPPRLTTTEINSITSPAQGLMAYDTDLKCMKIFDGSVWNCLGSSVSIGSTPLSSSYAFGPTGNSTNEGYGIAVDASGNIYVAGYFYDTITFGVSSTLTSAGSKDVYLAKYSSSGEILWVIQIGGSDTQEAIDLAVDASNNVYICGTLTGTTYFEATSNSQSFSGNGYKQSFITKFSSSGALIWNTVNANTSSPCDVNSMTKDASGNLYITGQFDGNINFGATNLVSNNSSYDIFVAKINPSTGAFIWAVKSGGASNENATDIAVDGAENVFIVGSYDGTTTIGTNNFTSRGNSDIFVAKLNASGNFVWSKTCGSTSLDYGTCITVSNSGNDVFFLANFYGTLTFGSGLGTNPITPTGSRDLLIAKLSANGDYAWATHCGNSSAETIALDITIDPTGNNFYFTGSFINTLLFRSINTPSTFPLSGCSGWDPFIAKYSTNGVLQWAIAATGGSSDAATRMTLKSNTIYTTGYFDETINFGFQQLYSSNITTFIWRYSEQ